MKKIILSILLVLTCGTCFAFMHPPYGGGEYGAYVRVHSENDSDDSEESELLVYELSKEDTNALLKGIEQFKECIICYEELKTKSTPCCNQQICSICWFEWLKQKLECPYCRAEQDPQAEAHDELVEKVNEKNNDLLEGVVEQDNCDEEKSSGAEPVKKKARARE